MNLKVYTPEVKEEKNPQGVVTTPGKPAAERTLGNVRFLELDFDRNIFTVQYMSPSGVRTREDGEMNTLFRDVNNRPDSVFTSSDENARVAKSVPVESAVGHLTDPTTVNTSGITKGSQQTKK
jgi:hypothetical protein